MLLFNVENMTCGHCVKAITQALTEADADAQVKANVEQKEIAIETTLEVNQIIALLEDEGYSAQLKV